jgi:hypothetical protein
MKEKGNAEMKEWNREGNMETKDKEIKRKKEE